jgi:MFS family permease
MESTTIPDRSAALQPLYHRQFLSCWLGSAVSHSANWMQNLTVPFVVLELTGSQTWLGIAAAAQQAPALFVGLLSGVISERYPRKRVLLVALSLQMLSAWSIFALWSSGGMTAPRILPLLVLHGIAASLYITAWQSYVPLLVPSSALLAAYRLNSVQFTFSRGAGPAVAGLVLEAFGPGAAFGLNAASYVVPLLTIALSRPRAVPPAPRSSALSQIGEGLRYALGRPVLWIPILTATWVGAFAQSLQPLAAGLAKNVFEVGEFELGLMPSAVGVAALIMSILITFIGDRVRRSTTAQFGLFLYALGVLAVGATRDFEMGLLGFAIMGLAHVMVQVSVGTSMQLNVDERFRGRVNSIYLTSLVVAIPVGALIGGAIGDWVGLQTTVRLFAGMMLLYAVFALTGLQRMRALDTHGPDDAAPKIPA